MSDRRSIVAAALLVGCGYYPEVAVDLRAGNVPTGETLEVCAAPGNTVTGCERVPGTMAADSFGTASPHARFVFDRSTPGAVRVVTAIGWAEFRISDGAVLGIAASAPAVGSGIVLDCSNPAFVCGSASNTAVCQPAASAAQCP